MADLRDIYNDEKLQEIAEQFQMEVADFPVSEFLEKVQSDDWGELSLRQRHERLARSVFEVLNRPYNQVAEILQQVNDHAQGFSYLFLPDMVALYGLAELELSLATLGVLTTGSTAEFAIRPFLEQDFTSTFAQMQIWAASCNEHHRRLASEGLRPNLPWGKKVSTIEAHRQEIFDLLATLKADSSLYVRKSVANHLNDWTKKYPEEVLDVLEQWQGSSAETDWICKQAARTLLKASHPRALILFGYRGNLAFSQMSFSLGASQVSQGDKLTIRYAVQLASKEKNRKIRLELQLGFVKKSGKISYKTFMLKDSQLEPGQELGGQWTYDWVDKTTRKHQNGQHVLRFVVNGQVVQEEVLEVVGFE